MDDCAGALFAIERLLHLCENGDFYADYDESAAALLGAQEAHQALRALLTDVEL